MNLRYPSHINSDTRWARWFSSKEIEKHELYAIYPQEYEIVPIINILNKCIVLPTQKFLESLAIQTTLEDVKKYYYLRLIV